MTVSLEFALAFLVQFAVVIAFLVWMKADTVQTKRDVRAVKKALGMENGRESAFVREDLCKARHEALLVEVRAARGHAVGEEVLP